MEQKKKNEILGMLLELNTAYNDRMNGNKNTRYPETEEDFAEVRKINELKDYIDKLMQDIEENF